MAKDSDECEFWLPPQFLADDDDLFVDLKTNQNGGRNHGTFRKDCKHDFSLYRGFGPLGPYSGLSSPVEGSTETESDDDDFFNELNHNFATSTPRETGSAQEHRKGRSLSGSPQSTLCSALGGCDNSQGSSRGGSPNGHSRVTSPPKLTNGDGAFDLLKSAAGEVARMRLSDGDAVFPPTKSGLSGPPSRNLSPISIPPKCLGPNLGFVPNQPHVAYQHLKAEQLKHQQLLKQQINCVWGPQGKYQLNQNHAIVNNSRRIGNRKPNLSMSSWPTLQQSTHRQQPGAGMRAVFLGNSSSKRECPGTGVFLPRRFGAPTEIRKKQGCSTVFLPDRVVKALNNLNWEATEGQVHHSSRYTASTGPDYEAALRHCNGTTTATRPRRTGMTQEIRLPQEWTY